MSRPHNVTLRMISILLVLLLGACVGRSAPVEPRAAPGVPPDCPTSGATAMVLPTLPQRTMLQFMIRNSEGEWRGFRLSKDNQLWRTSREGLWQLDGALSVEQVAKIEAAIVAASLDGRPLRYGSEPPPDDAQGWALQTPTHSLGGLGCRPTFVDTLISTIAPQLAPR